MRTMLTSIFGVFLLIIGCGDGTEAQKTDVLGGWSLVVFEPGFAPTESFDRGKIIWDFRQDNTIKIQIDSSIKSTPVKTTGEYEYFLDGSRISIEGMEYDFSIKENSLIISDDPSSDGFRATFSRISQR